MNSDQISEITEHLFDADLIINILRDNARFAMDEYPAEAKENAPIHLYRALTLVHGLLDQCTTMLMSQPQS